MNGAACVEAECCEFVEVDPTGRYGRVYTFSFTTHQFFLVLYIPSSVSDYRIWISCLTVQ